jgi:glyoxylase-like metal-dependent hydrolase (beta-lactamase superfamily II)
MKQTTWFTVDRVRPNIFAFAEFSHHEKVVSYLVVERDRAILFDTGLGYENIATIVSSITSLPVIVFLTHAHWDHIGSATSFSSVYLFDHAFERAHLLKGFRASAIPELSEQRYFSSPFTPKNYLAAGKKNFTVFKDAKPFVFGDLTIEPVHTPGHTPGSVSYFLKEQNVLIVGDTLYPGPLYAQLPESNIGAYAQSLLHLTKVANADTLILPGHNATSCSYGLLFNAATLMRKAASYEFDKQKPQELKGDEFSILL